MCITNTITHKSKLPKRHADSYLISILHTHCQLPHHRVVRCFHSENFCCKKHLSSLLSRKDQARTSKVMSLSIRVTKIRTREFSRKNRGILPSTTLVRQSKTIGKKICFIQCSADIPVILRAKCTRPAVRRIAERIEAYPIE